MTKQKRIDLAKSHITQALESLVQEKEHEASLLQTMESFPIYASLKKKYPNVPSSYEEFLALRIPGENEEEGTTLYEWNLLHQWDINHTYWKQRISSLQTQVETLAKALKDLEAMEESNDPLLDCAAFYSDFLGSLRIDLSSDQLQEFLDE